MQSHIRHESNYKKEQDYRAIVIYTFVFLLAYIYYLLLHDKTELSAQGFKDWTAVVVEIFLV